MLHLSLPHQLQPLDLPRLSRHPQPFIEKGSTQVKLDYVLSLGRVLDIGMRKTNVSASSQGSFIPSIQILRTKTLKLGTPEVFLPSQQLKKVAF